MAINIPRQPGQFQQRSGQPLNRLVNTATQVAALEGAPAGSVERSAAYAGAAFHRVHERQAGLERSAADSAYAEALSELMREAETNQDLSDPAVMQGLAQEADNIKTRLLDEHTSGDVSRGTLQNALEWRRVGFGDSLSVKNIQATDARISEDYEGRINSVIGDIRSNPDVPLAQRFAEVEQAAAFLGVQGRKAESLIDWGNEQVASAVVSEAFLAGELDEEGYLMGVRELLEDDEIVSKLSGAKQLALWDSVQNVENGLRQAGLEFEGQARGALRVATEVFGLSGEDAQNFAMLAVGGASGRKSTATERAAQRLVDEGVISQELADKLQIGAAKIVLERDDFGEPTGRSIIIDITTQGTGRASGAFTTPAGQAAETQAGTGQPSLTAPDGSLKELGVDNTLWQYTTGKYAVTGLGPEITAGLQKAFSVLGMNIEPLEAKAGRQAFANAQEELISSLGDNASYKHEIELIRKSTNIEPGAFTGRKSLLTAMAVLDADFKRRIARFEADAADTSLPNQVQKDASAMASSMKRFREKLGVPEGITLEDIRNIPDPEVGGSPQDLFNELIDESRKAKDKMIGGEPIIWTMEEYEALEAGQDFKWGPTDEPGTKPKESSGE
jgi:hypothetical protein